MNHHFVIEISFHNAAVCIQVGASQRAAAATFDHSRLAEFSEQIQYDAPAVQQTPLVQVGSSFSSEKLLNTS